MLGAPGMDLMTLIRHVPPLLDACVDDCIPNPRMLRLANKEASQIAISALRSYSLTLSVKAKRVDSQSTKHTDIRCARMLQEARLLNLEVFLCLSCKKVMHPLDTVVVFTTLRQLCCCWPRLSSINMLFTN